MMRHLFAILFALALACAADLALADNGAGGAAGGGGGGAGSAGGGGGGGSGGGQQQQQQQQAKDVVTLSREDLDKLIAEAAKGKGKDDKPDPTLDAIEQAKKTREKEREAQNRIVAATRFNMGLETFLKEYAGVLPADAAEIAKFTPADKYENEVERSHAIKAALIQSFFKEEENTKLLSESQLAKWKAYQALGTVGRQEEAANMYDVVFEPAINQARAIKQSKLNARQESLTGSKDSDIVFRKVHEKQLRALKSSYQLNDVLHEQAKNLGIVAANS